MRAQETRGQIVGRVFDPSGAIVVHAAIKAVNVETNVSTTNTTNSSGDYLLSFLIPGTYTVSAQLAGFRDFRQEGIQVRLAGKTTVNIVLEVGNANDQIVVTGESPLVEAGSASMGAVLDHRALNDLPLKDGNPLMLTSLAPGVLNLSTGGWTRPFDNSSSSSFAIDGTKSGNTQYSMDGAPNNQRTSVAYVPPAEAVQEVKLQSATFDAAMGYVQGGVLNVSMKTGTNKLHGVAYDFLQNTALNANDFFQNRTNKPRTPVRMNRFGAALSGPVYLPKIYDGHNRTFFTYVYEGIEDAGIETTRTIASPLAEQREGNFSSLLALGASYQIYDPYSTKAAANGRYSRSPFPGNIIPSNLISPIAKKVLDYIPGPNQTGNADGTNNYYFDGRETDSFYSHLFRVDHSVSDKNRFFVRGNLNRRVQDHEQRYANDVVGAEDFRQNRGLNIDDVHIVSATFLVNLRYGYTRYHEGGDPFSQGWDLSALGFSSDYINQIASRDPRGIRFPNMKVTNYFETSLTSFQGRATDTHDGAINITHVVRSHNLRYGVGYRSYRENRFDLGNSSGSFTFGNTYVNGPLDNSAGASMGQPLAAFLLGLPSSGSVDVNDNYAERSSIWGVYIQDDWKLTSKLTLNLGLRWEVELPTTERYNRTVAGFDSTAPLSIAAAALANYTASPISQVPASQFKVAGGLTYAGANGVGSRLWETDTNNFMPRLGLAYAFDSKTVVRSGFGFFYDQLGIRSRHVSQVGYSQSTAYSASLDSGLTYVAPWANPFASGFVQPVGNSLGAMTSVGNSINFFNPALKTPYSKRWELSIQRQIGKQLLAEIAYVGNHGSALITSQQLNAIPRQYYSTSPTRDQAAINFFTKNVANPFYPLLRGTGLAGTKVAQTQLMRPFPQFTGINYDTNAGYSNYHSLQARLEKRLSSGFSMTGAYTWSKFLEATSFLNDTDPVAARVISDQDRPHRLVLSGLYELPFGKGRQFGANASPVIGKLIGGWQIQSIYQHQSGPAFGFTNAILYGTVDQIPLSSDVRTVDRWFNTSVFEKSSSKQLANNLVTMSPRFSGLRADGLNVCDVSVIKSTALAENTRLQFRTEFINAFNHAMFKAPNTTMNNSAFGQVTATAQWPRTIQMSLKLAF
jgi:hypothetical protein